MKIFVAGATGAIGRRLVPQLIAREHKVVGTVRSLEKANHLRELGAEPVVLDAPDGEAVLRARECPRRRRRQRIPDMVGDARGALLIKANDVCSFTERRESFA